MLNIVFFSDARALLVSLDIPSEETPTDTLVRLTALLKLQGYTDPPVSFSTLVPGPIVIGEVETVSLEDLHITEREVKIPEDATGEVWMPSLSAALAILVDEAERSAFPDDFEKDEGDGEEEEAH
jgi:hypothetical protein